MRRGLQLTALLLTACCSGKSAAPRPPVLLITLDTVRADRLGCYGYPEARTPTLDQLAAEGVRVERALTVAPITLPAHTSIFTGLYPIDHGVRDNGVFQADAELETLAEILAARSYNTAAFVSSHVLSRDYGLDQGFQHFDDSMTAAGGRSGVMVERRAAQTVNAALDWLEQQPPEPWFLWLHFYDPHHPYDPPPPFDQEGHPYDGELAYLDKQLGRFLQRYDVAGHLDRTLVVVTSDHGEGLGQHGEEIHGLFLYDTTMHVPLLLRYPPLGQGRRLGGQVSITCILPTILDLLELPIPQNLRGSSLLPALRSERPHLDQDVYLETQLPYYYLGLAAVDGISTDTHKMILAPQPELYDRSVDADEQENLWSDGTATVTDLRQRLLQLRAGQDPLQRGPNKHLDEEERSLLAQLGYVQESPAGATQLDPKEYLGIMQERNVAKAELARKNFAEAEALVTSILERCPQDASTRALLGEIYLHQDRLEAGIPHLQEALALRPDLAGAAQNLALAYRRLGKPRLARDAYDRLLKILPDQISAYLAAADLSVSLGEIQQAREYLRTAQSCTALKDSQKEELAQRLKALQSP
jgi:arylsulfatase A-like enzyme